MFHSAIQHVSQVPYFVWYSPSQDRTVSIHGALPWFGSDRGDWQKVQRGWTLEVEHRDGSVTYGLGRKPFDSEESAAGFAMKINSDIAGPVGSIQE